MNDEERKARHIFPKYDDINTYTVRVFDQLRTVKRIQERWEDEILIQEQKTNTDWAKSKQGIIAKAKEVGVNSRPGESWFELKNRINRAIGCA